MTITLDQAKRAIIAAKQKAIELNAKMNICIVEAGGSLFNIEHANGRLISFSGGIPIKNTAG
jgi:uncharacterized protein GlcG (DUF336 family)